VETKSELPGDICSVIKQVIKIYMAEIEHTTYGTMSGYICPYPAMSELFLQATFLLDLQKQPGMISSEINLYSYQRLNWESN